MASGVILLKEKIAQGVANTDYEGSHLEPYCDYNIELYKAIGKPMGANTGRGGGIYTIQTFSSTNKLE